MPGVPDQPTAAGTLATPDAVFEPVRSQTAFEETVDRLGTAIKLGLLAPGSRLPAERELCSRLGIARSTLRQALTALAQSGHVFATPARREHVPALGEGGQSLAKRRAGDAQPRAQLALGRK